MFGAKIFMSLTCSSLFDVPATLFHSFFMIIGYGQILDQCMGNKLRAVSKWNLSLQMRQSFLLVLYFLLFIYLLLLFFFSLIFISPVAQ